MGADDAEPGGVADARRDQPGGDGAPAHHDVPAGGGVPRLALVLEGETRVDEALGDQVGRVVGAGGVEEEVLVVDRVRVDVIEFECGHAPMVGPAGRDGMRVARPGPAVAEAARRGGICLADERVDSALLRPQ